jgi:hypothetical protein
MSWKTTRALSATLFLGVAAIAATGRMSSAPSYAAPATETKNKALVDALNGAQADFKAGRFADALAKAKEADAIREDKPRALNPLIHGMIVKYDRGQGIIRRRSLRSIRTSRPMKAARLKI